jgi:hypothetical protein
MEKSTSKWVLLLRSEKWVLLTFVFITVPLVIHTQHLLLKVTGLSFDLFPYDEELYALFFALGFDLAMITFAINGRKNEATGLAFIVFLFNCFFLNYGFLENIAGIQDSTAQLTIKIIINVAIAGTASWIVHSYVVFFNDIIGERETKYEMFGQIEKLKKELSESTAESQKLSQLLIESDHSIQAIAQLEETSKLERIAFMELSEKHEKLIASVKREMNGKSHLVLGTPPTDNTEQSPRYVCEHCNGTFRTAGGLGSHVLTCKARVLNAQPTLDL